jgi:AraC family transcriptional regulator
MFTAPLSKRLEPQRIADSGALTIAGFSECYAADGPEKIPAQWTRFAPHIGHIAGQKGDVTYGVCIGSEDGSGFQYLAGVEVSDATRIGKDMTVVSLPPRRYAVFFHSGHISTLHSYCVRIWSTWAQRVETAKAPYFERYDDRFDPRTGNGGVEIWIPLAK